MSSSVKNGAVTTITSASGSAWRGTTLSEASVWSVVRGVRPADANGLYVVFTSSEIKVGLSATARTGFCVNYCGFHSFGTYNKKSIKFAFVGDPSTQCAALTAGNSCAAYAAPFATPNGSPAADAMASVFAHEITEVTSDPNLNAWFAKATGSENADLCSWNFGAVAGAGAGPFSNTAVGGRKWLIQQNWLATTAPGKCALSA